MLKVSIITPCLNGAAYIRATLESVARQTYANIEHIVMDGGSTDGTHEIVAQYPRARLVVSKDGGMYEAINAGFGLASGDILAYLNADDVYLPGAVERAVAALIAGYDLVFSDVDLINEKGALIYRRKFLPYHSKAFVSVDSSTIPQPTTFWTRALYQRVGGFDTRFKLAGDFDFLIRACAPPAKVKHLGRPLAQFRIHGQALSQTQNDKMQAEVAEIMTKHGVVKDQERALRGVVYQNILRLLNGPGLLKSRLNKLAF